MKLFKLLKSKFINIKDSFIMKLFKFLKNKFISIKDSFIKYIASKNKDKRLKEEYRDLAPADDISEGKEYLSALHWAINNKRIKNIAIAGPYGSGKSSIINSYLKRHPIVKFKHLRISMATFIEKETDISGHLISFSPDQIEEGILKQLFYKVNHHKIPQSRYRKLHKISYWYILLMLFILIGLFILISFIFFPEQLDSIITMITIAGMKVGFDRKHSIIATCVFILVTTFVVAYIWRQIHAQFKVKEIKVRDATVRSDYSDDNSILNKNIDEIIYFFEETNYSIVFFEDLDRLAAPQIFVQLRELNTLLNNCDTIKRPIVFIYAVKDDIFTKEDRTKFFDFIIPVIPIINSTNSGEILLSLLKADKEGQFKHDITQDYVLDVAPFISDMRVLQNIYNEFLIYKRTLQTEQKLKLSDKLMMSLIIFKNLYPKDFSDLQMEKGIIKQVFENKLTYVTSLQNELQSYIDNSSQLIEQVKNDTIKSSNELKVAMMGKLTSWRGFLKYVERSYSDRYSAKDIIDPNFDFSRLCIDGRWTVTYLDWKNNSPSTVSKDDFTDICGEYSDRFERLKVLETNKIVDIQDEIEFNKLRKHVVSGWTIKRLIENYGVENVLSTDVRQNKLLVFMLRRGYIDEKYVDYINYFKGNSITNTDMNFILSIKNHEAQLFEQPLYKVPQILQRLQLHEFEQKEIYNFDLLEEMLASNNYDDKLNIMIKQLSDGNKASWKFIDEFVERTKHSSRFFELLSSYWQGMWTHIYNDPILSENRKSFYLSKLCSTVNVETIVSLNNDQLITTFIEEHKDILQRLSDVDPDRLIVIIPALKVSFSKLDIKNVDSKILEFIFKNRHYKINADMIHSVVEFKNSSLCDRLGVQNYTVITTLNYAPLLEYVHSTIDTYIDNIVLSDENTKEGISQIIDLVQRSIGNVERCKRIVKHEIFCLDNISVCCSELIESHEKEIKEIWSLILDQSKVSATWENVFEYWKYFGLTSVLEKFISQYINVLEKSDSRCINDESFKTDIIQSDIPSTVFEKVLNHIRFGNFDIPLANVIQDNVAIMVKENFFEFIPERYKELAECYPSLCKDFIFKNQDSFLNLMEEISISQDVFEKLILDDKIDKCFKQKVISFYGSNLMTEVVAQQLYLLELPIEKTIFHSAWTVLDNESRKLLLSCNLSLMNDVDFQKCFSDLADEYQELANRTRRHDVLLTDNENHRKLVKHLLQIGYLTSYETSSKREYSLREHKIVRIPAIRCRVKAIPNGGIQVNT